MTFFQDCSCESARAGMYELDNKSSIRNPTESRIRKNDGWRSKGHNKPFFLTLMGYERKTSLSIVRVGGRGRSSSLRGWWPFSCHIGLICDFFGYFSTAGKLQFPYQIKCSTYLYSSTYFHLLQRILNSILNLCRLFRTFRIPFFCSSPILQLPTSDLAFSMFLLSIGL